MSRASDRQQVSERAYGAAMVALKAARFCDSDQERNGRAYEAAYGAAFRALAAIGWPLEVTQGQADQVAQSAVLRAIRRTEQVEESPMPLCLASSMPMSTAQERFNRIDRAWEWPGAFTATWILVIAALAWPWFFLHGTARIVVGILWTSLEILIGSVWLANRS
jgi:hypothetical protein